jgi:hypothetical protein
MPGTVHSTAGLLACLVALGGCSDPEGRLDAFEGAFPPDAAFVEPPPEPDAGTGNTGDAGTVVELPDVTGTHFLTLVPAGLGVNIYYLAETELAQEAGTGTLSLALTALSVEGLAPTGAAISLGSIAVNASGEFSADFGEITIPGAANPVSGTDIIATITLNGTVLGEDVLCGVAEGAVTVPIALDLAGTTWAGQRVPPGTTGTALPAPVLDCNGAESLLP